MTKSNPPRKQNLANEILDLHVSNIRWWQRSPYAAHIGSAYQDLYYVKLEAPVHEYLGDRLNHSETIYVAPDIVTKLWSFSKTFKSAAPLSADDLPCEQAWCWLATPAYILDVRGRMTTIRAISWSVEPGCVVVFSYGDRDDKYDENNLELRGQYGDKMIDSTEPRNPILGWEPWPWGSAIRTSGIEAVMTPHGAPEPEGLLGEQIKQDTLAFKNFVIALWEFMQEQIPGRSFPDRSGQRQLTRSQTAVTPDVLVIDLRTVVQSYRPKNEDPELVIWSRRWKVRQHKRRWYDKHGVYRETTVREHLRGPAHLPYIEKDRMLNVRR